MKRTHLAPEHHAYPAGGQTRKCLAICEDGKLRIVWAGIPDTYFSIPSHTWIGHKYTAGYVSIQDNPEKPDYGELMFYAMKGETA